jgi:two-component system, sensor histidine kinase
MSRPDAVSSSLSAYLVDRARPLVASFDPEGLILGVDGEASHYGLAADAEAALAGLAGELLTGLARTEPQFWPLIEFGTRAISAWWVPDDGGGHLVLADTHDGGRELRERQQAANELALASVEKSRTIRELKRARAELEARTRALDEAQRFQKRLVDTLSHDLRTPLTSIMGYAGLLEPYLKDSMPLKRALGAIQRNAMYLKALAENLLEMAGDANGDLVLFPRQFDLAALAVEIEDMIRPMTEGKGLALTVTAESSVEGLPCLDDIKLRQILVNLLSNAVRYTRQGRVSAELQFDGQRLSMVVADTGIGIAPEYQQRVFEPLNRGAQQGKDGAGLGLWIVRQLVQRMGGEISLQSVPGVGTRIAVSLPEAPTETPVDKPGIAEEAPPVHLANRRVLVVDDDPDICQLLLWSLRETGYEPEALPDAEQAVERVRAEAPGMVIVDVELGTRSGLALTQELRLAGYKGTIVVFSGAVDTRIRQSAHRAGADAFLPKPLDLKRMLEWLRSQLPQGS